MKTKYFLYCYPQNAVRKMSFEPLANVNDGLSYLRLTILDSQ